jgi:hypothetical protein
MDNGFHFRRIKQPKREADHLVQRI